MSDGSGTAAFREQAWRISVNAFFQIGGQLLPLIVGAASIPALYRNLGAAPFGIFTVCLSALGLFSLLDLGLGRATVRFAVRAIAEGRPKEAASVVIHSAKLLGGFSLVLGLLVMFTASAVSLHWFHAAAAERVVVQGCVYILAFALPFSGLTSVFRSVLEAHEAFRFISANQVVLGTATYAVPLCISYVTQDVRWLVSGAVLCRIVATGAFFVGAMRVWPGQFPWSARLVRGPKEFGRFSFWTVLSNVVGSVIVYADRALLVRVVGLSEVAFYNVPLEILGRLMIIVNSAVTVVFPSLSRNADRTAGYERIYATALLALSSLTGAVLLLVSVIAPSLIGAWLGPDFQGKSSIIVRILLVGLAFQVVNVISLASLNAKGFARPISFMHLSEIPIYLSAVFILGSRFGLVGVAIAWSARLLVESVCFRGFEFYLAAKGDRLRHIAASLLIFCNFLPLCILGLNGGGGAKLLAMALWMVFAVVSVVWVIANLKGVYRRSVPL